MTNKVKILGGVVGAAIVLNVVGAKIISTQIEDGVIAAIDAYSEQARVEMEVVNFQPNWFSSKFQIKISLPLPLIKVLGESFTKDFKVTEEGNYGYFLLSQEVDHGPIAFTEDGPKVGLAAWKSEASISDDFLHNMLDDEATSDEKKEQLQKLWPQIKDLAHIELKGRASLLGHIYNDFHIQGGPLDIKTAKEKLSMNIEPMNFEWSLNNSYDTSDIIFDWAGMKMKVLGKMNMEVSNFTSTSVIKRIKPRIWLGSTSAHIGKINGTGPKNTQFNFDGINVVSDISVDQANQFFDATLSYEWEKISVKSPKVNVFFDGLKLDASASEIPLSLIDMFLNFSDQMQLLDEKEMQDELLNLFKNFMSIDYQGNIDLNFAMNDLQMDIEEKKNAHIKIRPLDFTYRLNNTENKSDATFLWKGLEVESDDDIQVSFNEITSTVHQTRVKPDLWLGSSDLIVNNLKVNNKNSTVMNLDKISLMGSLTASDDPLRVTGTLINSIENFNFESPKANVNINSQSSDWEVTGVPTAMLEIYQKFSNPFRMENISNPKQNQEKLIAELASIEMQPTIKLKSFDMTLQEGATSINGTANFTEPFSLLKDDPKKLLDLAAHFEVSEIFALELFNIAAESNPQLKTMPPEQRTNTVKAQLAQFASQGLLIEQNDNTYTADITTVNGFLAVNGKPMVPLSPSKTPQQAQ